MTEHPLITAMKSAGPMTQRIAHSLTTPYYGYTITEAARLADALIEDQTGETALNDRWRAESRDCPSSIRLDAKARTALRTTIATTINNFPREYRDRLCKELAEGRGAQEADELLQTIDAATDVLIANIRARVAGDAQQTA